MKIYHYKQDGEYVRESEARLDPLEHKKGIIRWLLPANATFQQPPSCLDGEIAVMKNGKWVIDKVKIKEEVKEEPIVIPDQKEIMISEKMRELAIEALKVEGKL
jgi:hypothetical protein